jgi:NAD(P)-dependent dehydrogenase (short-subunit alcohol dehydrogenase family)
VHLFDADLADPDAATDLVAQTLSAFGELGVVVNNAFGGKKYEVQQTRVDRNVCNGICAERTTGQRVMCAFIRAHDAEAGK